MEQALKGRFFSAISTGSTPEELLSSTIPIVASMSGSQFYGLYLYANRLHNQNLLITNNSDETVRKYEDDLLQHDFIFRDMIAHDLPVGGSLHYDFRNQVASSIFYNELQKLRPCYDGCYLPLRSAGQLIGHVNFCTSVELEKRYTIDDYCLLRFCIDHVAKAIERSLELPVSLLDPLLEINGNTTGVLFFDIHGSLIHLTPPGARQVNVLFGKSGLSDLEKCSNSAGKSLRELFLRFIFNPGTITGKECIYSESGEPFRCSFQLLGQHHVRSRLKGIPAVAVGLHKESLPKFHSASAIAERCGLTKQERTICEWVLKGNSNKQIAAALHIAESTVKRHLQHTFEKVHVKSRTELIFAIINSQDSSSGAENYL